MRRRWRLAALASAIATLVLVAGCGDEGSTNNGGGDEDQVTRGGIYRMATEDFAWTNGFDPTGEYLGRAFSIYSSMLLRTLVTYRHVAGPEGNEPLPDLAEGPPEVSADGRTYTFTLKAGVKFSPPVDREITSRDIAYAFERIGTADLAAQYGYYYTDIVGMTEFTEGKAVSIAGIATPDDRTISFELTDPSGDFLYRLALPATAPIPREVARCVKKPGEYGRYLIASGPYMVEGSADLDVASCKTMEPISGFDPEQHLRLERNPNYDPATDSEELRSNYVDGFSLTINTNTNDIFKRIETGQLEGAFGSTPPAQLLRRYTTDESLKERLKVFPADRLWFITMNLTQAPFDDVHVRKAVNLVMDKDGLRRVWGGPTSGDIATHVLPDAVLDEQLADYDPFPSENHAGDVEAAKEEMRQSQYDSDGDGLCDADACKGVLLANTTSAPWSAMDPIIVESLAKIGIELTPRQFPDVYEVMGTVSRSIPIMAATGWVKDFADPSTFQALFDGRTIIEAGNSNSALIGLTLEKAKEVGAKGNVEGVPSVDADLDACKATPIGEERLACWVELDRKITEEIVPWVPFLDSNNVEIIGPAVTSYAYDQFSGLTGLAHVAVDTAKQVQ